MGFLERPLRKDTLMLHNDTPLPSGLLFERLIENRTFFIGVKPKKSKYFPKEELIFLNRFFDEISNVEYMALIKSIILWNQGHKDDALDSSPHANILFDYHMMGLTSL